MKPLLIVNCHISGRPASVLVRDGKVAEVQDGLDPSGAGRSDGADLFDAGGGSLLPGLVDTHCHPFEFGALKKNLDLRGVSNITGLRLRLAAGVRRAPTGGWVVGRGWDHEAFPGGNLPGRRDIDDVAPSNPVVLTRVCGHIALLNSPAISKLGLEEATGPEYDRDEGGGLTGIVREGGLAEVYSRLPRSEDAESEALLSAEFEASRSGLTCLHAIVSKEGFKEELGAMMALEEKGSLSLKYRVYIPHEAIEFVSAQRAKGRLVGPYARVNGVKVYADGSLGARTAALREPYSDDPSNRGMLRYSDEELGSIIEEADAKGFQVIVHAIGDRAVEQAATGLSKVTGGGNPRHHRVEHASLLPGDLRSKLAKHSISVSVQPMFIVSDTWAERRLGEERTRDLYPLKSMVQDGLVVSGSSDSPVESMSPVLGMWASMDRGGANLKEALGARETLDIYTVNARTNGLDPGVDLRVGATADFTLLDSDIEGMHPALLRKVGVSMTLVGGSVAYSAGPTES